MHRFSSLREPAQFAQPAAIPIPLVGFPTKPSSRSRQRASSSQTCAKQPASPTTTGKPASHTQAAYSFDPNRITNDRHPKRSGHHEADPETGRSTRTRNRTLAQPRRLHRNPSGPDARTCVLKRPADFRRPHKTICCSDRTTRSPVFRAAYCCGSATVTSAWSSSHLLAFMRSAISRSANPRPDFSICSRAIFGFCAFMSLQASSISSSDTTRPS